MAGWFSVLKLVPWAEVIAAAPKVAGGARKLWDSVGREPAFDKATPDTVRERSIDPTHALAARIDHTDAELADLRAKLQSATGLIATLADQNQQLIARIDAMRVRMLWLGVASGAAVIVAIAALLAGRT